MYRSSSSSIGNDINNLFWSFLAFFERAKNFVWLKDTVGVMLNFLCMKGVDLIGTFIQTF